MAIERKSIEDIADVLKVKTATAEVYVIDGLASGAPIDHEFLAAELRVDKSLFLEVKIQLQHRAVTLRTVKDNLERLKPTYNQIRFVLASLIRGYCLL